MHPTADTTALIVGNRSGRRVIGGVRSFEICMTLLSEALPNTVEELAEGFIKAGRPDLANQLRSLDLICCCPCGDDFCATFYTAPNESWYGRVVERFILDVDVPGLLCVQVVDGKVARVEMLHRPDIKGRLSEVLSSPHDRT